MPNLHIQTLGQGKPIVMIHGWAMHSGIWRDFAEQLAAHYHVTLVDLPGHGHSEALAPFTLEAIIDSLVNTLPEPPCCWLGWSLGATVVLELARRYPERVSSLVLVAGNPCFLGSDTWPGMRLAVLDTFAANLQADAHATLLRFLAIQVMALPNAKALTKALKTAVLACPAPDAQTLQGGLDILKDTDLRASFAGLKIPVLVVLGKKDSLIPAALSQHFPQLLPTVQVQVVDQAAHIPFLSHPQELLQMLVTFMEADDFR
ncbi:MAG: pimeloyl-ACP methyl ester esterase BioH [Methylovulum sp.]|nr:pimeloyl-ACP methyl ester esterase BioH [Methylovulum sp.]